MNIFLTLRVEFRIENTLSWIANALKNLFLSQPMYAKRFSARRSELEPTLLPVKWRSLLATPASYIFYKCNQLWQTYSVVKAGFLSEFSCLCFKLKRCLSLASILYLNLYWSYCTKLLANFKVRNLALKLKKVENHWARVFDYCGWLSSSWRNKKELKEIKQRFLFVVLSRKALFDKLHIAKIEHTCNGNFTSQMT